ncbi:Glutamate receptor-like 44 [Homarus americanus]|uniref:Glutamate receptor-like 44 n=1 Tax=Homarus americanus TaxID=6706 RepID=A0A8J5TIA6_HOMAM|nr:Glutamate receptor-like 44 [Homarus americanus]
MCRKRAITTVSHSRSWSVVQEGSSETHPYQKTHIVFLEGEEVSSTYYLRTLVLLPVLIKWKVLADEDSWRTYPHPIRNVNTLQTFIKKKLNEKNDQFVRDDEDFRGIIYNNRSQNAVTMLDPDPSSIKNTIIVTNEANSDEDAQIKEDECLDGWVTRPEKLGVRAGQILNHLGVPSFALVTQCEAGWVLVTTRLLLQEAGEKGVSSCLFDSVSSMKKAVMTSPYDARCFSRRQWTVVLLGGHTWASDLIHSTSNLRFYDQRVHWVVVGSAGVITSTLAQYHHTQRVTWLRWSSRARDWVVLVSKATAQGLVAREAGRWVESGQHTHFRVSRPLTPPFPTNFFHSPLRVVSRHPTDQTRKTTLNLETFKNKSQKNKKKLTKNQKNKKKRTKNQKNKKKRTKNQKNKKKRTKNQKNKKKRTKNQKNKKKRTKNQKNKNEKNQTKRSWKFPNRVICAMYRWGQELVIQSDQRVNRPFHPYLTAKLTPNSVGRCYYAKEDGRNITKCTGYVGEMLMLLTQDLNLTIVNSLVHSCGVSTANGTRVTVISYGEADIALGTCTITTDRLKVVDFTEFFAAIRSTIASAEPALVQSPFLIFNVLSSFTWMVVAVYVLVVTVVVWVVARILGSVDHHYASSVTHAFALIFKANLFQAHSHQPWSVSVRAVVAVSWVGVITVAGVYSGNLTAWLSLPRLSDMSLSSAVFLRSLYLFRLLAGLCRYEKPVDSLADLVTRPDLMPIVSLNDPNHQMFQGIRRRVTASGPLPSNWQNFLRNSDNKEELFSFLSEQVMQLVVKESKQLVVTDKKQVLTVPPGRTLPTWHHATTKRPTLAVHAADALECGHQRILIRTVDTDVVILAVALANERSEVLDKIWLTFGTGKNRRYIAAYQIAKALGPEKSRALPVFHAITGSDTNQTEGSLGVIRKRLVVWNNSSGTERMRAIIYQKHVAMNSDRSHISRATALNKVEGRLGFAPCRIHLGRQDVRQDFLGLMINKNSWFKEQMNERIRWLRSYGIIQYLYKQFNQPGCRVRKTGEQREFSNSLTLWQLEGVYWVWLVGAATSTFALLMELFLANYVDKCDHHH